MDGYMMGFFLWLGGTLEGRMGIWKEDWGGGSLYIFGAMAVLGLYVDLCRINPAVRLQFANSRSLRCEGQRHVNVHGPARK
jgi:hypothetical protein